MKHHEGDSLFYFPLNYMPCHVINVTKYYEDDDPNAFVSVRLENGDIRTIPVRKQHEFLTAQKPKPRPETRPIGSKFGNFVKGIFTTPKTGSKPAMLLFLLLLAVFAAGAQSGEPVSDTSYITKTGDQFFEVRVSTYQDGSEMSTKSLIGDTAALVQAAKDRLISRGATMSVDVRHVSTFRKAFTELLRESDAVKSLTGIDPQRAVQDDYSATFLAGTWTIKRDATTSDVVFTVNGQGALRYSVNAGATKSALLIGNALRLKNYPSNGTDTDMYVLPGGAWVDATRATVLRPPGNNNPVNRAARPAPVKTKG